MKMCHQTADSFIYTCRSAGGFRRFVPQYRQNCFENSPKHPSTPFSTQQFLSKPDSSLFLVSCNVTNKLFELRVKNYYHYNDRYFTAVGLERDPSWKINSKKKKKKRTEQLLSLQNRTLKKPKAIYLFQLSDSKTQNRPNIIQ